MIVTGPSGSGKTTLLTLIGTLRTVQEGSVEVLGHQLLGATAAELALARREIGFIFQAHNLFESLTALQNVRMAMELFDFSSKEITTRATELLTRLGLGERVTEVLRVLDDLRRAGCDLLTLGQYLQPTDRQLPVARFVPPAEFGGYEERARALGFRGVAAAPLVRSSYRARALHMAPRAISRSRPG